MIPLILAIAMQIGHLEYTPINCPPYPWMTEDERYLCMGIAPVLFAGHTELRQVLFQVLPAAPISLAKLPDRIAVPGHVDSHPVTLPCYWEENGTQRSREHCGAISFSDGGGLISGVVDSLPMGASEQTFPISPDPIDVPAIQGSCVQQHSWCDQTGPLCHIGCDEYAHTCKQKSRFLLQSVDQKWHCIKFGAQP